MSKSTILITQLFMTMIMAFAMSGILSLIAIGPTAEWLATWPKQFLMAWPIAFVITHGAWPLANVFTRAVLRAAR